MFVVCGPDLCTLTFSATCCVTYLNAHHDSLTRFPDPIMGAATSETPFVPVKLTTQPGGAQGLGGGGGLGPHWAQGSPERSPQPGR